MNKSHSMRRSTVHDFAFGVILLLAATGLGSLTLRTFQRDYREVSQADIERIHPDVVRALSMGLWPSWVDYMWLETLLDPLTSALKTNERSGIFYNLDVMTELDEYYFEAYVYGANLLTVIRNDHLGARDLLLKGIRFIHSRLEQSPLRIRSQIWQTSWSIPLLLGYVYLFELDDVLSAKNYLEEASTFEGSPLYLKSLVGRLNQFGGPYIVGINLLRFMQQTQIDPKQIDRLKERQRSLEILYHLFLLNDDYENSSKIKKISVESYLKTKRLIVDPWGGKYRITDGKINTETPYEKVFGLK